MRVYIFRNSPSPTEAIYRLQHAAAYSEKEYGLDGKCFVKREFYVDGILSKPTAAKTIDLLT